MFGSFLLLLLLLAEGALGGIFCTLPDPSTEAFNISTAHKTWHEQYRYPMLAMDLVGCLTITQNPGDNDNKMVLSGSFSHTPLMTVAATATLDGNRLITKYSGLLGGLISGPRNIVYINDKYYIDHYCMLGTEVSTIFTADEDPSDELMEEIWQVVDSHSEVKKSKYKKITC